VAIIGFLRSPEGDGKANLLPSVLLLIFAVLFFFILLWTSFLNPDEQPRLRPGETITI
jgi:Mg2+/citrate symporter